VNQDSWSTKFLTVLCGTGRKAFSFWTCSGWGGWGEKGATDVTKWTGDHNGTHGCLLNQTNLSESCSNWAWASHSHQFKALVCVPAAVLSGIRGSAGSDFTVEAHISVLQQLDIRLRRAICVLLKATWP
jgi:hypothetical protein